MKTQKSFFEQNGGTYAQVGDTLTALLNEDEKKPFEDFMDTQRGLTVLTDCETFCYAFKSGAKIMLDVLTEGQMREI